MALSFQSLDDALSDTKTDIFPMVFSSAVHPALTQTTVQVLFYPLILRPSWLQISREFPEMTVSEKGAVLPC